ncbi:hypothetical protein CL6EHI_125690 [Entamoeba histolytica]|nr:hypothetical protein CL6EHI_125690 [Entamoeba histolytica]
MLTLLVIVLFYKSMALPKIFSLSIRNSWGNKYQKIVERRDNYLSLIDNDSQYTLSNTEKTSVGYLFQGKDESISSKFSLTNEFIELFVPLQIQRKVGEIGIVLSEESVRNNDLKTGKNGLEISLKMNNKGKDQMLLTIFNNKDDRYNQVHTLTCKSLKSAPRNTGIYIVYNGELNTISTDLYLDGDQVKCSSENFIKIPKKVFISLIGKGFNGLVKEINIVNKLTKQPKQQLITKKYTIDEIKGKPHNEILYEIYDGIKGLYIPLLDASKQSVDYAQTVNNLKHYVRDTLIPKCGNVEEPINIQEVLDKVNKINITKTQDSIKELTKLDAFNELNFVTRNPTSFLFWFITLGVQGFTVFVLYFIIKKKKRTQVNMK